MILGDEGDPLQASDKGQYYLFGITSYFGKPCGESPAVYTKAASYLSWILDNMNPSSLDNESNCNEITDE